MREGELDCYLKKFVYILFNFNSSDEGSLKRRSSSRRSSKQSEQKTAAPVPKTKLIENEDSATGSVDFGVYLRYFKSVGIPFSITIFLFNAINQSMSVLSNSKLLNSCKTLRLLIITKFLQQFG